MTTKQISTFLFHIILFFVLLGCHSARKLSNVAYYKYDKNTPLNTSVQTIDHEGNLSYEVIFSSTHHERVTGILSHPGKIGTPVPVVILVHGLGDNKEVDYIKAGEEYLRAAGYAVLRIDLYNHGARRKTDFDFSFDGPDQYRSREVITQSVFDLRRAIDFIESREELDHNRIGYFGISLGGIIGTVLSGVDTRIKVPVIVLAGGRLNLMYGKKALSQDNKNYLSTIDPVLFVDHIAPRPLLMINSENDEVIPPITTKFLYKKAKHPKKIIWYPAKHRTLPVEKAYFEGITWFDKYL